MPRLCICKICQCGRHHCACDQRAKGTIPTDGKSCNFTSEMKESYQPVKLQGRILPKKLMPNLEVATGPMAKTTTTAHDYTPKSVPHELVRPKRSYMAPSGKLYDKTTYRHDYTPNRPWPAREPLAGRKPNNLGMATDKMETVTTQIHDYPSWNRQDAEACRGKICGGRKGNITMNKGEFTGQSETARCFKKPGPTVREIGKGKLDHLRTEGCFEGKTITATDYTPKVGDKAQGKGLKGQLKWPDGRFKNDTTYKTDYKAYRHPSKTQPCGPRAAELQSTGGKFQGDTSYKVDYPAHAAEPRFDPPWKPSKEYERPTTAVEGDTTYRKDYPCPPEVIPEKGKGQTGNIELSHGPMSAVTTHRNDFTPYDEFQPVQSCKKATEFSPPTTKFADETTTRRDYTGRSGDRTEPLKTEGNIKVETGPMESTSMTHKDFIYDLKPCPAGLLRAGDEETLHKYKFIEKCHGHEYYEKLRNSITATA